MLRRPGVAVSASSSDTEVHGLVQAEIAAKAPALLLELWQIGLDVVLSELDRDVLLPVVETKQYPDDRHELLGDPEQARVRRPPPLELTLVQQLDRLTVAAVGLAPGLDPRELLVTLGDHGAEAFAVLLVDLLVGRLLLGLDPLYLRIQFDEFLRLDGTLLFRLDRRLGRCGCTLCQFVAHLTFRCAYNRNSSTII